MDYREEEYFDNAVCSFGKVLSWDNDDNNKTRLILKARMADLESIPHFIVFSKAEGFENDSWTIQCEILQQEILRAGPPDEDHIPTDNQVVG